MKNILIYNTFRFLRITHNRYHYNDNRHGAPSHYIAVMEKGHCRLVTENKTVELAEGDVFYIPISISYQSYWYGNDAISLRSLGFAFFPETKEKSFSIQKINCSDSLKEKLNKIPVNCPITSCTIADFYNILSKLIPLMQTEKISKSEEIYIKAKEYITKNTQCKASDVAKYCAISESTLYWAFKTSANVTPNDVKNEILCEKAITLLSNTDKSVQEISDSLGFSSTSYFRKILKLYTGKTPLKIRKEALF